jgi:hypothetical protein
MTEKRLYLIKTRFSITIKRRVPIIEKRVPVVETRVTVVEMIEQIERRGHPE